jgi:hypothetical protein
MFQTYYSKLQWAQQANIIKNKVKTLLTKLDQAHHVGKISSSKLSGKLNE